MVLDCLAPLICSSIYVAVYAVTLVILLVTNQFGFTNQLKVVLGVLFVALIFQFTSCYLIFDSRSNGKCEPDYLTQTLFRVN